MNSDYHICCETEMKLLDLSVKANEMELKLGCSKCGVKKIVNMGFVIANDNITKLKIDYFRTG